MENTVTITGLTTEQVYYVVDTIRLSGSMAYGRTWGADAEVTTGPEGLAALAALDEHSDGHFDGRSVWIGGTGYAVRGL